MTAVVAPYVILAVTALVALVAVSVRRRLAVTAGVAAVGFVLAAGAAALALAAAPRAVGPLFTVDGLALFVAMLVSALGLAIGLLAHATLARGPEPGDEFHVLLVLAVLGAAALAAATHFASLLLGLELLSVSLYGLIAYPAARRAPVEAGVKYLVLAGVASAVLVFGMACVYAGTGSLDLAGVAGAATAASPLALAGAVLLLLGLFFKLALVPLHMWTPDVYVGAPAPATAAVATVSKGAVLAVLWRLLEPVDVAELAALRTVLVVAGVASMLAGNLLALRQDDVKRILAYSSIAHLGYLLLAVVAGAGVGTAAVVFYLTAYTITMTAALGTVGALGRRGEETTALDDYHGLFWRRPGPAVVMSVALLSLAGIPLTAGFLAKAYVVAAGVGVAAWWLVAALVLGSAISMYYYLRVLLVMAEHTEAGPGAVARMPLAARLVLGVLAAAVVWLGVWPATLGPVTEAVVGIIP
jgi:NADH-quinone oxidoreductase subunit N